MAQDWLTDVRKYAADADEAVVAAIVKYCGIALQSRDSSLVAMSDKKEKDLVRENFLKKKLGLTDADSVLDEAISGVGQVMKADRTKNRVTVYYLLTEHFGLLNLFGGFAGKTGSAGVAGVAAAGLAAASLGGRSDDKDSDAAVPLAAAAAATGMGAAAGVAATPVATPIATPVAAATPPASTTPQAAYSGGGGYGDDDGASGGGMGWLKWLLLAAVLLLLIFLAVRYCAPQATAPVVTDDSAAVANVSDDATAIEAPDATATAPADQAVPAGSGVVAAERDGKPMLTVYFDSGKSEVSNDLSAAAANVKDYVTKTPTAKLAVSGYNDPTGNAAVNAEISKKRAQGVAKALEAAGILAASIELVKPADTTDAAADKTAARRVEVTIK